MEVGFYSFYAFFLSQFFKAEGVSLLTRSPCLFLACLCLKASFSSFLFIFNFYVFAWSSLMLGPEIHLTIPPITSAAPLGWPELWPSLQWLSHGLMCQLGIIAHVGLWNTKIHGYLILIVTILIPITWFYILVIWGKKNKKAYIF